MQSCRLITHCYAAELSQYAVFLRYQLMSLARCEDNVQLALTLCYCEEDERTVESINWFQGLHPEFPLRLLPLNKGSLFKRSIGRNIAALESTEDLVWFTDVDYVFLSGCFDGLFGEWNKLKEPKPIIVFPGRYKIHKNWDVGDRLIAEYDPANGTEINVEDFIDTSYDRPIGGVQIVAGETARKYGYLKDDKKHQMPTDGTKPFPEYRDDMIYRYFLYDIGPKQRKIQFPGVYRLRHSKSTVPPRYDKYKWADYEL